MDRRQSPAQSHLRPPPHHRPRSCSSTPSHSPSPTPRAPITAHPTATISDSVICQGTHPISIGAGTIIHPRVRIYSYDGPIVIGDGCIISEKTIIGVAPVTPPSPSSSSSSSRPTNTQDGIPIRLSFNVVIGPLVTILPGAHIHSGVVIEALAIVNKRVSIGPHSKVCARCEIAPNAVIGEYTVVWGAGSGLGLRRRVRTKGKVERPNQVAIANAAAATIASGAPVYEMPEGEIVEEARMVVLQRERQALAKFLAPSGAARKR